MCIPPSSEAMWLSLCCLSVHPSLQHRVCSPTSDISFWRSLNLCNPEQHYLHFPKQLACWYFRICPFISYVLPQRDLSPYSAFYGLVGLNLYVNQCVFQKLVQMATAVQVYNPLTLQTGVWILPIILYQLLRDSKASLNCRMILYN